MQASSSAGSFPRSVVAPLAKQELCFWNKNPNNEGIRKMNQHRAITSHPHWLLPRQPHRPRLRR